ncbi:MAG: fasciclin domain-containing protein [Acholeplasma sp.]|jgi:uncharacterized surface protein with fasciclin (FAS1) repeats|nr:fasciclin domain-containing protein [Acholeplasma sp.]
MGKKWFSLISMIGFVLVLAGCASSALTASFQEQALSYDIHQRVLQATGYFDELDSAYVDDDGKTKDRFFYAYPDSTYEALFTELGILERDFYCTPTLDAFIRNTIFDIQMFYDSYTPLGSNMPEFFLHAATLHGDRYTYGDVNYGGNRKFSDGYIMQAPGFDSLLQDGLIPYDIFITDYTSIFNPSYYDEANPKITLLDEIGYEFGVYYVLGDIQWPTGVEKPAPGVYCSVGKAVEFETSTSAFYALTQGAETYTQLKSEERFTVFAPTNTIINDILSAKSGLFTQAEATRDKDIILRDHTVAGDYSFTDLRDMAPFSLESLSGKTLRVQSDGTNVYINGNKLTNPDMVATNGVIHGLEGMLYKPVRDTDQTIVDVVNNSETLDVIGQHLETLALSQTLSDNDFTLFVPNNDIYTAWLTEKQVSIEQTSDHDFIRNALLSHVIEGSYSREQLLVMTELSPIRFESLVEGTFIEISQDTSNQLYANGVLIHEDPTEASNGYVHTVESVLIQEPLPELYALIADLEGLNQFDTFLDILAQNAIFLPENDYTVFGPLNDPILDWMIEQNIDVYSPNAIEMVSSFIYAHMTIGIYTRDDLLSLTAENPLELASLLPNTTITISQDELGNLYANETLIVDSYDALNGSVHTLDGVILLDAPTTLLSLLSESNEFTILVQLLAATGLDLTLDQSVSSYTIFAPTDAAFTALMVELQIDMQALSTLDGLTDILNYHILSGINTEDTLNTLYNSDNTLLTTLLVDRMLSLSKNETNELLVDGALILAYTDADNGTLISIDQVLMPEPADEEPVLGNLIEVLIEGGVYEIFIQALQTTGLNVTLTGSETYTVFAPLDGYFTVKMIQEEITLETLLADPALLEFLRSHIVLGSWDADSLKALLLSGQDTIYSLNNTPLVVTQEGDFLFINGKDIIVPNMFATNGVIHSMAGFLVEF